MFLTSGPRFAKELLDDFNSSNEFNSFWTSQNRRIFLHWRLYIEFVWIKFDDNATYKQGLSHRSLKGRETLHYLVKSPLPVEPCLAYIRAAVLVEWHLRSFVAKMKTNTKKHKRDVFSIARQCLWHFDGVWKMKISCIGNQIVKTTERGFKTTITTTYELYLNTRDTIPNGTLAFIGRIYAIDVELSDWDDNPSERYSYSILPQHVLSQVAQA